MKHIYQNFDGLDVSFMGAFPDRVRNELESARIAAQQQRGDFFAKLGANELPVMVKETGARGGYKYTFDTGPDGEVWFIADSPHLDRWNIRVSARSLALALYGYEGVKGRILAILTAVGALGSLEESISRVDYCFDFVTEADFQPVPANFIAHKNCKKGLTGEREVVTFFVGSSADRVETLRVGSMPGRQATIYNKTQEIKAHHKSYWWEIWKLDPKEAQTVWRVEVRAGKDELNKWGIKRFSQFETKGGDLIVGILEAMRYVVPTGDSNRARWPLASFWKVCIEGANHVLAPYRSHANRENILLGLRQEAIARYERSLHGHLISYAALVGMDISELPEAMEKVANAFWEKIQQDREKVLEKFRHAEQKFAFLT